jgi:2-hydroxychromene-2-carboxylate isomerase
MLALNLMGNLSVWAADRSPEYRKAARAEQFPGLRRPTGPARFLEMERRTAPRFYFDYVDPLSWLMDREIDAVVGEGASTPLARIPLEVRRPPDPLLDPDGPWWRGRWETATAVAATLGIPDFPEPRLLPWTRKAHEFVAHATAKGVGPEAHRAVFEAFFARGEDIGRVDVLVRLGQALGLDPTEAKVVLDVDRYAEDIVAHGREANAVGGDPPFLVHRAEVLQGFHNRDAVRTFLRR